MTDETARPDLLLVRGFLDAETCASLRDEARRAEGVPAVVYVEGASDPVNERIRRTTRVLLSEATISSVARRLMNQMPLVAAHFGLALTDCEMPQFLFYREGDFFVAHQDGNTVNLDFDHLRIRKISIVVFLNDQSEKPHAEAFGGGSLVFHRQDGGWPPQLPGYHLAVEAGLLVAFRSDTIHEVLPVTHGERFTIVSWFR